MKTGVATTPLHGGRCPKWLFKRMTKLSKGIVLAIREEFGADEVLQRLSDPVWFQSLGCVIGFDWHSSGITTTTMGALKEGISGLEGEVGLFICGGKGRTSNKTPSQIRNWVESLGWNEEKANDFVYASKLTAKTDSSLVQDNFHLYHHNFIFSENGKWTVVQQGLNAKDKKARRYHWFSSNLNNFVQEPHSGIASEKKLREVLNLTAEKSNENRKISTELVNEEPRTFLKNIELISSSENSLAKQERLPGFAKLEMKEKNFHSHPVLEEKFDIKRLEKIILSANSHKPENFEQLLSMKGIGPKTIRALSLVSEIIYGAKPSYEDPARYSFAHGGKDGIPEPIDKETYDETIDVIEKGIKKSEVPSKEKEKAQKRLNNLNV